MQAIRGRDLFLLFSKMGLMGFGGVLPFAYRYLVERAGWLSDAEFAELLALAQLLPGPTICNMAVIIGQRHRGARGAAAALAGLLVGPFFIVLALGMLYQQLHALSWFSAAIGGMGVAAAGLVLATALKLLMGMRQEYIAAAAGPWRARAALQAALVVGAFTGLGVAKLSLIVVVAIGVPLGIAGFAYIGRKA